jgi:predicted dehydrogenase
MVTVRVGVIGVGMIGQGHIRRITQVLRGGTVVAVTDADSARATQVAAGLPGVTLHPNSQDLIADTDVDAVLVASSGPAHAEHVLAAIEAGKPVFCEKPLVTTAKACQRIIDAEMAAGRCWLLMQITCSCSRSKPARRWERGHDRARLRRRACSCSTVLTKCASPLTMIAVSQPR